MYNGKSFRTWIFIILIVTLATIPSLVDVVFAPSAPSQVPGVIATAGPSQVSLSWTAPSNDGEAAITDYIVQHTTGPVFSSKIPTSGSGSGSGNGQFNQPRGIAIDSSGNIWVTDTNNHRIQKFDSTGSLLLQIPPSGSGTNNNSSVDGSFYHPQGIAIDSSGNIWVADTFNNRIQKFNSAGVYQSKFGTLGNGDNQFNTPRGIATDSSGNIWVADTNNHRIQKFNSAGVYQSKFGTLGNGDNQFNTPRGIATEIGRAHV